ncbi:MAG: hypothetical protein M3478_12930 [Planctomycetota bacterium]|nr:hypothetical protein [Planctomycetota bacterium]
MSTIRAAIVAVVLTGAALAGCGSPSKPNITLRKKNAALREEIISLKAARESDMAAIRRLESNATTVPVLPHDRVDKLFTAHGLKLGKLTGGWDADRSTPGDEGLQIFTVPTDQAGDEIKATGTFVVDAFDLSKGGEVRLGHWEFPTQETSKKWLGNALQYGFIFEVVWQTIPTGDEVTIRTTFTDELTGRVFTAQRAVKVVLPPPPPATQAVTQR